jgi:protein phosphatase
MKDPSLDDTQPHTLTDADGNVLRVRPPVSQARIEATGMTHTGRVRQDNQDHFLIARLGRSLHTLSTSLPSGEVPRRFDETGTVMMVADGMGGAAGGEIASRTAIQTLVNILLDVPDWILRGDDVSAERLVRRTVRFYRALNAEISERARVEPDLSGMGTTMTVAYAIGQALFIAHVGDSRAYLLRDGELRQLTRDHTHVQRMVDDGTIAPEEAATHRLRHVLTNVIGGGAEGAGVEIHRGELLDGDRLLVCSDGLTEVVRDDDIAEVLRRTDAPEFVCRTLVDLALERGGPDNVTVIAARCTLGETEPEDA